MHSLPVDHGGSAAGDPPSSPKLHTLHYNTTNSCNLSCSFCYINAVAGKTDDIPLERLRGVAREAARVGAKRVVLSGGEPFARRSWRDVFGAFADAGLTLSVVSNGTLLTERRVAELATFPGLGILISLDGDAKTHDEVRGKRGAHDRTIRGINRLLEAGIQVQINSTLHRRNLADAEYLARLSRDLDVSMRFSLLNTYNGRGVQVGDLALDPRQIIGLREFCHELRQRGSRVFLNLPPLLQYAEDVVPANGPSCGWAQALCGLTYDGYVTICGVAGAESRLRAGSIFEKGLDEIWLTAPLFHQLRSMAVQDLKGVCARCPVRWQCGGACRLSGFMMSDGDFAAPFGICEAFYQQGYIPDEALDSQPLPS